MSESRKDVAWCLNCLEYFDPSGERQEGHHIYPRAATRSSNEVGSSPILMRTISLHRSCHISSSSGIQQFDSLKTYYILKARTFDNNQLDLFLGQLDKYGLFELSTAFWQTRIPASASISLNNYNAIVSYAFSSGGDLATSQDFLLKKYNDFKRVVCKEKMTQSLAKQILIMSGSMINAGFCNLVNEDITEIKNNWKRLPYGVKSLCARREVMINGTYKEAVRAAKLTNIDNSEEWGQKTALIQIFMSSVRKDTLKQAIDKSNDLSFLDETLSFERSLNVILSRYDELLSKHSLFHYTNLIFAFGVLALLQERYDVSLNYLYRAHFLCAVFGIRLIPIWNPMTTNSHHHRVPLTPDKLIDFIIGRQNLKPAYCRDIRINAIGPEALIKASSLTNILISYAYDVAIGLSRQAPIDFIVKKLD